MKLLTPEERIIIAADFDPQGYKSDLSIKDWVEGKLFDLMMALKGSGVCIKINSVLALCGYEIIWRIQDEGFRVFADPKFYDISRTLSLNGAFLREFRPDILTVACSTGLASMRALREALP